MSVDTLRDNMLSGIPDSYQKTVGFPTYDIVHGFAIGAAELFDAIEAEARKLDVDNLTGGELTRFAAQYRGIDRRQATRASGVLTVTGSGTVSAGDLFASAGGVQFRAAKTVMIAGTGEVPVEAVTPGAGGNVPPGSVTEIPVTIQGIVSCTNAAGITGGYDAEDDDALRARYYASVREPPTSGNKAHYRSWALETPGVGGVKVFPLGHGDWTVDVVLIDAEHRPADEALVARVQAYIDPDSTGLGDGKAPIGAHCYVSAAQAFPVNVSATLRLAASADADAARAAVSAALTSYLTALPFHEDKTAYVSLAQVGAMLLDADGVLDYDGLTLNGAAANVSVGVRQVAVLGEVTLDVAG